MSNKDTKISDTINTTVHNGGNVNNANITGVHIVDNEVLKLIDISPVDDLDGSCSGGGCDCSC